MPFEHEETEFDPSDPYQAMCDTFRREVMGMFADAGSITIFRELPLDRKLSSHLAGSVVGALCVLLISTRPEAREEIMSGFIKNIPALRKQAESIVDQCGAAGNA